MQRTLDTEDACRDGHAKCQWLRAGLAPAGLECMEAHNISKIMTDHKHEFQVTASIEAGGLTLVESRCAICGKRRRGYAIQQKSTAHAKAGTGGSDD